MWYYSKNLNTLSNFDESEIIKYEYELEDEYYGSNMYTVQDFYHISDINKINIYKKVIISESDIELICIGKKAQLFFEFNDDLNTCYVESFSLSYVETEDEVKENYNTFFLTMVPNKKYYSKRKCYNEFCIYNNIEEMSYFKFTFLEDIEVEDHINTFLLK